MPRKYLTKQTGVVTTACRHKLNKHKSGVIWLTGLSGSGKSTIAHGLEWRLYQQNVRSFVLDGDNIRHGLCNNIGFSKEDRKENIRRAAEAAKLFMEAGLVVLVALISPFSADRNFARSIIPHGCFIEIYCSASLEVCEMRDVKGLYRMAKQGEIQNFTGISADYEPPKNPDLICDTDVLSPDETLDLIMNFLTERDFI